MKIRILLMLILFSFLSCNQQKTTEKSIKKEVIVKKEVVSKSKKLKEKPKQIFIDSVIPSLILKTTDSLGINLRLPCISDYDHYYFSGYERKTKITNLPFFCEGYFNGDSLIDYSAVFIKDTTEQFVYGFISEGNKYTPKFITKRKLVLSENGLFNTVTYNINTEKEKILEGIDTVYRIEYESIGINDMYESYEYAVVWNEKQKRFVDLLFD